MPYSFNWYKFLNPKGYEKVMQEVHDAEVRAKAIDEFAKKLIELVYEFPLVENEDGEKRPMTIEEMCNQVAEQLKTGNKNEDVQM